MTETPKTDLPPPTIDHRVAMDVPQGDIFFAAVETTRMPMIVTDPKLPDNPIIFCNRAFSAMTGYAMSEIVGRNCRFLQGADTDRDTIADVRAAIEAEREIAVEVLNYKKDGSSFWNALFISPVLDPQGNTVYFFASQLDISRRRDAEDALRQAQKMEAVGQLTGGIAHDFNNLLQVIVGYVDVLGARMKDGDPRALRAISAIGSAAQRGATLTAQLLAFARKQDLQGRIINLNTLVGGFDDLIDRTVTAGIEIDYDLVDGLPNCRVDPVQVEMALLNVLINARDAMDGSGRIRIATACRTLDAGTGRASVRPGDYVELSVSDDGPGIPADILGNVFEPFFTTKEVGKGTGLGLSMVYGFAKQSGGIARIESEVGKGTTIRMLFPQERSNEPKVEGNRADARQGSETILLVEDQDDVALLAETILSDHGYRVVMAQDAAQALAAIERGQEPDLLFTDVIMPGGMNGVMLAREIRKRRPGTKILLTTGYADRLLDESHGATSEFDVLHKPYRRADLVGRVRQILDGPTGIA